jgi:hypothetical protein
MLNGRSTEPGTRFPDRSAPGSDPAKRLKRSRAGSSERNVVDTRAGPQEFTLVKAAEAGVRAHDYVPTKYESPWRSYQKVYELKLDGFVVVAIRKAPSCELVTVKSFSGSDRDGKVKMLQ